MQQVQKVFTERLNNIMQCKGITITRLSETTGLSKNTIGFFVRGERTPNGDSIKWIANDLGVSSDYLLGLTDVPTTDTDLRSVCDYIGLSEKTVKNLRSIRGQVVYDQEGENKRESAVLLRMPDIADPREGAEEIDKEEARKVLDSFFSSDNIGDFFAELTNVYRLYSEVLKWHDDYSSISLEYSSKKQFRHAVLDLVDTITRIVEQGKER